MSDNEFKVVSWNKEAHAISYSEGPDFWHPLIYYS